MSARTLTNVVNDQTVALNALIYGYAGHSLVTPQHALQQIWWTEERINEKVTTEFITSRLRPNEREWVHRPVGFGDLTDDTYIEWILEKARRLFLILAEIGEADRIFGVVEKSWDDDDLPLSLEDIEQLALANVRDDQANARFYHTQFSFLLRVLREGAHIDYAPHEEIPLEYVMGLPPAVSLQNWSRVHLPKRPHEVYMRRKFALGHADSPVAFEENYIMDIESAQMVEHEHIAPVWASYTAKGSGYTLTDFVGQHTLRTFIDHRNPSQYQKLPKPERRYLVLNWLHCLADAVTTLHQSGFCHSNIRPTNIIIDDQNNIAFSDIGSLETFQRDKKPDPMDAYVYSAPETQTSVNPFDTDSPASAPAAMPIIGTARKPSIGSKSSSGTSSSSGSQRQKLTKAPASDFSGFNFGFKKNKQPIRRRSRVHETEQADVFSLGCVFLEMITFMLKKKPHEFLKHRSSKQRINTGGRNSRLDSSYHANMEKIESWMKILEDLALTQEEEVFRAIPYIMHLIRNMLGKNPNMRPSARDVRDRLFGILLTYSTIPYIHCGAHKHDIGVARSANSESDRTSSAASSSVSSFRTSSLSTISSISTNSLASSTSTVSSNADTIRWSSSSSPSTATLDSSTDTIRWSIPSSPSASTKRLSSILNSYSDRSTLSGISEIEDDDSTSTHTVGREPPPPVDTSYESPRRAPAPPTPPISPRSPRAPTSPASDRSPSPSSSTASYKVKPWNKPFLLLP